ncbi:unnamed protein product [Rhizoctonia solani]|uniref:UBC core domain-containing protein n=1 Tax=Rhizoctonia solani TaxID=456999 RepID=A0A8H3D8W4_9AGAM|nr:unnamed protein product [Rhizoctonia solani]
MALSLVLGTLRIECGDNYPDVPPVISFVSKVNLSFVGPNGKVDPMKLPVLANWIPASTLETILVHMRREMAGAHNRKLPQPPEGSVY